MRTRWIIICCFLVAATCLVPRELVAQNKRIGSTSGTQLLIPVGGRDLARGGASIAIARGVEAIHWNPAGLGSITQGAEGMFSTMSYLADITVNYGGVAAAFGDFGVLGLSIRAVDFGDIKLTTREDPLGRGGRLYSPTFVTLGLTYARSLTDAISAGGTLKLLSEQIERVGASGFAIDIGVQYSKLGGVQGLNVGVTVKNIGPRMQYDGSALLGSSRRTDGDRPEQRYKIETSEDELPSLFEIGLAYTSSLSDNMVWNVASSFTNKNLGLDEYRLGGELGYTLEGVQLFGRVGMGFVPQAEEEDSNIFGTTFGMGLLYSTEDIDITVDYAYRSVQFFDANQVISVKFGF